MKKKYAKPDVFIAEMSVDVLMSSTNGDITTTDMEWSSNPFASFMN